ncbi:MAG: RsmE family RNA methyltransferase [Chloroflexota bacterium]
MHRFFVEPGTLSGERIALPAQIAHQVTRVLRLREGERIVLLEDDGREAVCRLEAGELVVETRRCANAEPRHRLVVCQALLKGDALEGVVRHGTEIGVAAFQLIVSRRCVARDLSGHKLERLRSIAREAAEQSERARIPVVEAPKPLSAMLEAGTVVLHERLDVPRLSAIAAPGRIVIGPEGGWDPGETETMQAAGVIFAGLGPRILRSESVALAAAAVVLSRSGDFA